jgi:hypothetical protein
MRHFMITVLLIVTFTVLRVLGYSQFAFKTDTSFENYSHSDLKQIDSSFHLDQNNDFELHLWSINYFVQLRSLFILSYKNKVWSSRFFKMVPNSRDFVEYKVDDSYLDSVWKIMLRNKVLAIPAADKLRDKKGKILNVHLLDGTRYWFELLTRTSKRSYNYYCPKSYFQDYPYIKSYKRVANIIETIYKIAGVKFGPC